MEKPRYAKMSHFNFTDRQWPDRLLEKSPQWCAVDLRDGNQALANPLTVEQKKEYFQLLVKLGFKEIEVGFPSASKDDFDFCRTLITENLIPEDVTISVLTQSRAHLIEKTFAAIAGAKRVVIHSYVATSELHYRYVFKMEPEELIKITVKATAQIKVLAEKMRAKGSFVGYEFSPEEFTDSDLNFCLKLCSEVVNTWQPAKDEKVIINLPMTVERRLPNEYADLIERFIRTFPAPEKIIVSLHVHNDMGCAVAATMLALKAGATRVEGTLFGHGERTGNVDLVTVANNLEYLGLETGLDFSNILTAVETVEKITKMHVNPRQPYAGDLVFTAFSGSHQDAIRKCLLQQDKIQQEYDGWKLPYLHVAPEKLGRNFENFIRINSQSGKGGIAFVLEHDYQIKMPRWLQIDFSRYVKDLAEKQARELLGKEVYSLFKKIYVERTGLLRLINYWPRPDEFDPAIIVGELHVEVEGELQMVTARGNGPISAFVAALKKIKQVPDFTLLEYHEQSMGDTAEASAICFVKIQLENSQKHEKNGVASDVNTTMAAGKAIISSLNRLLES